MHENLTRLDVVGPALARALGDPGWERLEATLVSGGKSNLTFELSSGAGEAVLRRPPDGPLLPRAHDMGREARIAAGAGRHRGPGGHDLVRGRRRADRRAVLRDGEGRRVRDPGRPARRLGGIGGGPVRRRRRPHRHAGRPARHRPEPGRPDRLRPAVGPGGAAGAPVERPVGAVQEPGHPGRRRARPPAPREPAHRARRVDRARGLPDRQHHPGQGHASRGQGRARLGAVHPGGTAGRPWPVHVLLARAQRRPAGA